MSANWKPDEGGDLRRVEISVVLTNTELELFEKINKAASCSPEFRVTWFIQDWVRQEAASLALKALEPDDVPDEEPRESTFDDRLAASLENNKVGKV